MPDSTALLTKQQEELVHSFSEATQFSNPYYALKRIQEDGLWFIENISIEEESQYDDNSYYMAHSIQSIDIDEDKLSEAIFDLIKSGEDVSKSIICGDEGSLDGGFNIFFKPISEASCFDGFIEQLNKDSLLEDWNDWVSSQASEISDSFDAKEAIEDWAEELSKLSEYDYELLQKDSTELIDKEMHKYSLSNEVHIKEGAVFIEIVSALIDKGEYDLALNLSKSLKATGGGSSGVFIKQVEKLIEGSHVASYQKDISENIGSGIQMT
ncbi:MAG: hypothetical protein IBX55_00815 [Methyloprofundus sp.]|nr:hypothetical protein [Methyloprofundus sp.]